jgi:ankyrin repeat protein
MPTNKNLQNDALIEAILGNQIRITTSLLIAGLDPNIPNKNGEVPLEIALKQEKNEMAFLLLRYGAYMPKERIANAVRNGDLALLLAIKELDGKEIMLADNKTKRKFNIDYSKVKIGNDSLLDIAIKSTNSYNLIKFLVNNNCSFSNEAERIAKQNGNPRILYLLNTIMDGELNNPYSPNAGEASCFTDRLQKEHESKAWELE